MILERFIPWGKGREIREEVLNKDQWKAVTKTLLDFLSSETEEDPFLPYQAFQVKFDGEDPELLGAPCVVGSDGLCVMPDGDVFPCRRFPVSDRKPARSTVKGTVGKIGNLGEIEKKRKPEGEMWNVANREGCRGCRSLALSMTGDDLAEDPHCWSSLS